MIKLKTITYLDTSYSKRFENRINSFGARPLKKEAYKEEFIKTAKDVGLFRHIGEKDLIDVLDSFPVTLWNVKLISLALDSKNPEKAFECLHQLSNVMLTWLAFITVSS